MLYENCFTAHLNARSLVPHFNDIRNLILTKGLDILAISGTWLKKKVSTENISISGFKFVRVFM